MSIVYRDYQQQWKHDVYAAWQDPSVINVMGTMATGGGKTSTFCWVVGEYNQPAVVIAHRQELVGQAALALNRAGIPHGIIAPKPIIRQIIALENDTHGHSLYRHSAPVRAAGIDTFINHDTKDRWLHQVALAVVDEGHHVIQGNKWHRGLQLVPNSRGLFPTAHAIRGDRKGLGRRAAGLADRLVIGPHARNLIDRGFLTDYRLVCVGSDIDFSGVPIGSTGDYSLPQLRKATHESNRIVGDAVTQYRKYADGGLGITFAVDVEAAAQYALAYRAAGIPCEVITAKTPLLVRGQFMRQFRARQIKMLISVDCLGEGVDVPAVEIVIMARKTASWQLYCQQAGRCLRPVIDDTYFAHWEQYTDQQRLYLISVSSKPAAIIVDLVGNWAYFHDAGYGLFDSLQQYDLDGEGGGQSAPLDPLTPCLGCSRPYERFLDKCPYCKVEKAPPTGRSAPEMVEGDIIELDPKVLAALRANVAAVDAPPDLGRNPNDLVGRSIAKRHQQRQEGQGVLRHSMNLWAGHSEQVLKHSTREIHRRFFHHFGIDYISAQALGVAEAMALNQRVCAELTQLNIVEATNHDESRSDTRPEFVLEQSGV